MDDRFYGNEQEHWSTYAQTLQSITREEVNAALKKYLTFDNVKVVFITPDAEGLKKALVNNDPSPITYQSPKPDEIYKEDEKISAYPLEVKPENITIVDVDSVFEG
jgi:zinc protease